MPTAPRPLPSPRHPAFARNGGARGHADPGPSLPICAGAVRTRAHRPTSPRPSRPSPSPFPLVRATPLRAERGMRGQRPIPWRPVCAGRSAREGAPGTAQKVSPPHLQPTPVAHPSSRAPPPPSFAQTGTQEGHAPAPPCPRTQEGGQRAHHVPWCGRRQPSPTLPTHARGGAARPPSPLRAGDASPAARTSHRTARARKGRGQRLRTGYAGPVLTRPAMPADAGGSVRPAQPLPRRVHHPVYAREEARARGPHASTHAKGHGMRDGATRGNEAKRSRGEAAHANSGTSIDLEKYM
ncbi:hypothetical protein EDB84DRAFT_1568581 [Lactarius hengduanensis]|nr:hypothetical protein EDB84DRAFT_1568581 [Lactarius hengduanensis]